MPGDQANRRMGFIEEFQRRENRRDVEQVVTSLDSGLSVLRDLLYGRLHYDVEQNVGTDSMLMPLSEVKTQHATKVQIDLYQVIESAAVARQRQYVSDSDWYLDWLLRLRLGELAGADKTQGEIATYRGMNPDSRRLTFSDILMRVLPESREAPMVLYQLVPPAIQIVTAMAFGDKPAAAELRQRQKAILPAIADCHTCHGAVLKNGDFCDTCSNPVWTYQWLTVAD
jgi:hypothetical protein